MIVEPKQMLYWNVDIDATSTNTSLGRTETNVVLKLNITQNKKLLTKGRTETNVVLK